MYSKQKNKVTVMVTYKKTKDQLYRSKSIRRDRFSSSVHWHLFQRLMIQIAN